MKAPLKLGITGGIGSGKTSVCKVFSILGIPVFSADQEAKEIMDTDSAVINKLNEAAGRNLYSSGTLDRKILAELIFNDSSMISKVNSVVHPAVFEKFGEWTTVQTSPYVIMEAAILFESGGSKLVDLIATVVAPTEERIRRVIDRSGLSPEQILGRMRNQMDDEEKIKQSDYLINNSEKDMIIPAVLKIHENILAKINT